MYLEHRFSPSTPFNFYDWEDSCKYILIPEAVFHAGRLNQLILYRGRDVSVFSSSVLSEAIICLRFPVGKQCAFWTAPEQAFIALNKQQLENQDRQ